MSDYLLPVECSLYFRKSPTSLDSVPSEIKVSGKEIYIRDIGKWIKEGELQKALKDLSEYAKHKRNAIFGNILAVEGEKENDGHYSIFVAEGSVKITLKKGSVLYQNIKMKPTKYRSASRSTQKRKKSKKNDVMREEDFDWDDILDTNAPKRYWDDDIEIERTTF